ncbi:hypothetical protein AAW51_4666 [Caldimonas brevitalea]|uniref:Uncharacterized protein n=1 Tax=Caldimonas brevitalea TaxID=413882 RepID=A0A0G3BPM1_9BURK|nr:hypothetical protein AAW51_4666 [Caldimonas brevitalea]
MDLSAESVAGEEDPGAGMDMALGHDGLSEQDADALGPPRTTRPDAARDQHRGSPR